MVSLAGLRKSVGNTLYRQLGRVKGRVQNQQPLPVDVLENDTTYLVVFDAPGAGPDDIQVRYLDGNVKVRVDRFRQFQEGYEMRFPGRGTELSGEAELPPDAVVNPDAGTAKLTKTGALRIEIPKASAFEDDANDAETDDTDDAGTEGVAVDD